MNSSVVRKAVLAALVLSGTAALNAQSKDLNEFGNPMKIKPRATTAAITAADLQTRLYIFSDDTMMGREIGYAGNMRGTAYIASELKKLGIQPGGPNGSYFQNFNFVQRKYTAKSALTIDGKALKWNDEFVALPAGVRAVKQVADAQVIFGGVAGDTANTITQAQAAGKVVLLLPSANAAAGGRGGRGGRGGGGGASPFPDAAAVATINLDALTPGSRIELNNPQAVTPNPGGRGGRGGAAAPATPPAAPTPVAPTLRVTAAAAEKLLGRKLAGTPAGTLGGKVSTVLNFVDDTTDYARNVIGIIPGSDPALKGQYVAISAHNDHVGYLRNYFADHDSVRAILDRNMKARIKDAETLVNMSPELNASLAPINMDSLRKVHPVVRVDSINNGADDDGSGSMGILEIAEYIQKMPVKPKRSTIFIWHTGEEAGMDGSSGFIRAPAVPLDSIVTAINVDMIGRGREGDMPGGGPKYLGVVGAKVLSMDVYNQTETTNKKQPNPFKFDFRYDTNVVWTGYSGIYGRSDHINYANAGIPIVFFFTGLHADYHQPTDEAQYIDYPHYAAIDNFIRDLLVDISNGPKPTKNGIGRKDQGARGGAGGTPPAGGAPPARGAAGGGGGTPPARGGGGGGR